MGATMVRLHSGATARLSMTQNHLSAHLRGYSSVAVGAKYSSQYKNYAVDAAKSKLVSYFHDVPIGLDEAAGTANMVVEVPRWLNAKFEISTTAAGNPIVQDMKKGKVRFVANLFPYHGYIHNYGAFPQTWEDPTETSDIDGLRGDGDPLDVCEIGLEVLPTGTVKKVKILGSLALIDDGELDWKVIVVNCEDALADEVFDIHDVFVKCPGLLEATREWFRDYKLPDGKPRNKFAMSGTYRNKKETIRTIQECHGAWRRLVEGNIESECAVQNVTVTGTPGQVATFDFNDAVLGGVVEPDAAIPPEVSRVHYVGN